jgi:ketosteroid isomerase-like protein
MNKSIIYVLVLGSLVMLSFQQKVDIEQEKEAIKAVNQKQLDAVKAADYEGEAAVWAHEPYIVHATTAGGKGKVGWDSLSAHYKKSFEERKKDPGNNVIKEITASNYDIQLSGNVAFIMYDEYAEGKWEGEDFSSKSKVVKHLIKKDGEWKITVVSGF